MAPPTPPASALPYLNQASQATGIPLQVVEAQNYTESAYGANQGPSSAGALGPWQFMPGTFTGLGFPAGQETSWPVSTQAYIKYMDELLQQEGDNLFKALEAYNAGPGNLSAGAGYASAIESMAGVSQNTQVTPGNPSSVNVATGAPSNTSGAFGIPGLPSALDPNTWIQDIAKALFGSLGIPNLKDMLQRTGLILLGAGLLYVGIMLIAKDFTMPSAPNASSSGNSGGGPVNRPARIPPGPGMPAVATSTGAGSALEAAAVALWLVTSILSGLGCNQTGLTWALTILVPDHCTRSGQGRSLT